MSKDKNIYDFASEGNVIELRKILTSENINAQSEYGETLLTVSVVHSDCYDVVKLLIDKGADINDKGGTQFTPVHWAASKGNSEIVKLLLESNANFSIQGNNNHTPLQEAVYNGKTEVVKVFREKGYNDTFNKQDYILAAMHSDHEQMKECLGILGLTEDNLID